VSFFDVVLPFVLLLGGLIFVHELGHFLVAKWFGVKVEKFSIGFGPALLRRRSGETEYVVAALPLGGYVKMLGELPGEELPAAERARAFNTQSVFRRVGISFAGPAMNLLLPVVVLACVYMIGVPTPTSLVGGVVPGSPAERAGLLPGDRIVAVRGEPVWRWRDFQSAVRAVESGPLALEIERAGERRSVAVEPERGEGPPRIGVEHSPPAPLLLVDPDSPALRAGLRSGDHVRTLGGVAVPDWYAFQQALAAARGPLEVEVARPTPEGEVSVRATLPAGASAALGLRLADSEIVAVDTGSPAARAGLQAGDLVVRADGEPIESFAALATRIRSGNGAPLDLGVLRKGREVALRVTPERRTVAHDGVVEEAWGIGMSGSARRVPGEVREDVLRNPIEAGAMGVRVTAEIFVATLDGLGKLVTREVGLDNIAGPIRIGELAAESYEESWFQFFWVMALISVNLAILNLLPIPILDGGQIVFALAEGIRGSPLSLRVREIAQQVGISLLLLLMGFAFWNDLSRHWRSIVEFFAGLS
jgi:regulator of sigma E protease